MRRYSFYLLLVLVLTCMSLNLIGCASSEPSRFYALSTIGDRGVTPRNSGEAVHASIGVGPVELPDYLDRPQIVTRSGLNELRVAEYNRWAGSLSENVSMAVRENLSLLLGTDRVFVYPWTAPAAVDYKITIKIIRLEGIQDHVELKAMWTVSSKENKEIVTRVSDYKENLRIPGYDAVVAATSKTVEDLSGEIAAEVKAIADRQSR